MEKLKTTVAINGQEAELDLFVVSPRWTNTFWPGLVREAPAQLDRHKGITFGRDPND